MMNLKNVLAGVVAALLLTLGVILAPTIIFFTLGGSIVGPILFGLVFGPLVTLIKYLVRSNSRPNAQSE